MEDILNGFSSNHIDEWISGIQSISYNKYNKVFKNQIINNITTSSFEKAHNESKYFDRISYAQYIDLKTYLPYDILTKVDISSMANSLETRPALIDKEVFKVAARLPKSEKIIMDNESHNGKIILKEILKNDFSREFLSRKKSGFGFTKHFWIRPSTKNGDRIKEKILNFPNLEDYFQKKHIEELWTDESDSSYNFILLIYIFIVWLGNKKIEFK